MKVLILLEVLIITILIDSCFSQFFGLFGKKKKKVRERYTDITLTTMARWTFDGMDYESDSGNPNLTLITQENKETQKSCMGEYVRCTLREPFSTVICGFHSYFKGFDDYYSICEIEYLNCVYEDYYNQKTLGDKLFGWVWSRSNYSHEMNPRWFDGDGIGCKEAYYYGYSSAMIRYNDKRNVTYPYWDWPKYYPKYSKYAP